MYSYKNEESDNGSLFYFKSDNNYTFNIQIEKSFHDLNDKIPLFEVSIDCIDELKPNKDSVVGITVCHIINEYLIANPLNILMYVCDSIDHKAHLIDRKFSQWYTNYNTCDHHILSKFKYNMEMGDGILEHYTSAVFDQKNYSVKFVENMFVQYTNDLNALKNNVQ